jgi:hypothetical protein
MRTDTKNHQPPQPFMSCFVQARVPMKKIQQASHGRWVIGGLSSAEIAQLENLLSKRAT